MPYSVLLHFNEITQLNGTDPQVTQPGHTALIDRLQVAMEGSRLIHTWGLGEIEVLVSMGEKC